MPIGGLIFALTPGYSAPYHHRWACNKNFTVNTFGTYTTHALLVSQIEYTTISSQGFMPGK